MSTASVFHLLVSIHFWLGCFYDWRYVKLPSGLLDMGEEDFSGKLKFLTFWDALLQGVFFFICFLNDVIGTNEDHPKKPPLIRRIRDLVYSSLAFPLAMYVGLTFWGLYFIDRELIFPKVLDAYFPVWLNHVMHTNIMIFIFMEMLTTFRSYPKRKIGMPVLVSFLVFYLIWLHVIHNYTGKWVYPILEVLNLPLRIIFFAMSLFFGLGLYVLGEKLNNFRWRNKLRKAKSKSR